MSKVLKHEHFKIFLVFIFLRLLFIIFSVVATASNDHPSAFGGHDIFESRSITAPSSGLLGDLLLSNWYRWDTGWYLKIAALGYSADDGSIIYPPFFPMLVRFFSRTIFNDNYLMAGVIVANVFSLMALILFYELAKKELGAKELGAKELAERSLIYWIAYPAAFYLVAAYSESTFFTFSLAAWLAVTNRKWCLAGIFAGLAALTRLQGWLLAIPLFWYSTQIIAGFRDLTPKKEFKHMFNLLTSRKGWQLIGSHLISGGWAIILFPMCAYLGYSLWLSTNQLGSIDQAYNRYWNLDIVLPWVGFWNFIQRLFSGNLLTTDWIDLILLIVFITISVIGLQKLKIAYSIYIWMTLVLIFMRGYGAQLIPGFMRYQMALFPVFWLMPGIIRSPTLEKALLGLSLFVQFFLLWAFLNWYWVA